MNRAFIYLALFLTVVGFAAAFAVELHKTGQPAATQPVIETVITQVRGCDIIQYIQGDRLIAAFPAPDQPETCKIQCKIANNPSKRGRK